MAKLNKEDFKKKYNERIEDVDLITELLEDVEDSFDGTDTTELETQISELQTQLTDVKQKYKERFLQGTELKEENKQKEENETNEPRKFENLFDEKGGIK